MNILCGILIAVKFWFSKHKTKYSEKEIYNECLEKNIY